MNTKSVDFIGQIGGTVLSCVIFAPIVNNWIGLFGIILVAGISSQFIFCVFNKKYTGNPEQEDIVKIFIYQIIFSVIATFVALILLFFADSLWGAARPHFPTLLKYLFV